MSNHRLGRFEVARPTDWVRTMAGAGLLIGLGEPLLSCLSRFVPRRDGHRLQRLWARATARFLGLDLDIDGLDNLRPGVPYVVAPLHEGFADAVVLTHLPLDLRFVARDELAQWPHLGRAISATDQILVSPESRVAGYRALLEQAERTLRRGQSLVMFPQGSMLGVEAGFMPGPFWIADRLRRPVLPVVLSGTHRVWEHPFGDRLRFGQRVSMRVLPPLPMGRAQASMRALEKGMKTIALGPGTAPARRFDPDRDGYWDGYAYTIDPDFPTVAGQVHRHRAASAKSRAG